MATREKYWIGVYESKDALWMHDGNSKRPHVLLTSGKHSNGFFNSRQVIPDEEKLREAARDLVDRLIEVGCDIHQVAIVVGPQTGATKLAEFIAAEIEMCTGRPCAFASPRKDMVGSEKIMSFSTEELELLAGKIAIFCEDVMTTGGSIERTVKATTAAEAHFLPFVAMLVNRSGEDETDGLKVVALISRHLPAWEAPDCPLCKQGSKAIPAKDPANWAVLNATYP